MSIRYRAGYKYQITAAYLHPISDEILAIINHVALNEYGHEFIAIYQKDKIMTMAEGYAWDGPSGPTIDTPDFMRGSLVHDALYQLMRDGYMLQSGRVLADRELVAICKADGMPWWRRAYVYVSVRLFGGPSADPAQRHSDIIAP